MITVNKCHHKLYVGQQMPHGVSCAVENCLMQINMFNTVEKEALCNHVNISSTTC